MVSLVGSGRSSGEPDGPHHGVASWVPTSFKRPGEPEDNEDDEEYDPDDRLSDTGTPTSVPMDLVARGGQEVRRRPLRKET